MSFDSGNKVEHIIISGLKTDTALGPDAMPRVVRRAVNEIVEAVTKLTNVLISVRNMFQYEKKLRYEPTAARRRQVTGALYTVQVMAANRK